MTVRSLTAKLAARRREAAKVYDEGFQLGRIQGFVEGFGAAVKLMEERAASLADLPAAAQALYAQIASGDLARTLQGLQR